MYGADFEQRFMMSANRLGAGCLQVQAGVEPSAMLSNTFENLLWKGDSL
jgi:hypothetical protein